MEWFVDIGARLRNKHMDMSCYGRSDDEIRRELDRRMNIEVRNVKISPLFVVGKTYNIDRNSPLYEQEDPKGTMSPETNHCWLTWQSKWLDRGYSEDGIERWANQAYNFPSIEKAELARKYIENK